jgi:hypothetical protein
MLFSRNRVLTAVGGMYSYTGASIVMTKSGLVWPDPADVKAGVQYGPTGVDYTGTLTATGGGSNLIMARRR